MKPPGPQADGADGDAASGNFHAALGIEQQVLRLDVPMQHPL
ncbi:MAG: hypothetical protein NTY84_09935 [Verrucomicrobia bacterium]|nr:hypothetical protein [Verrucomicrobiota bacterium]